MTGDTCVRAADIPASFQQLSANSRAQSRVKNLAAGQEQEEWRVPFYRDASSSAPLCRLALFFSSLSLHHFFFYPLYSSSTPEKGAFLVA